MASGNSWLRERMEHTAVFANDQFLAFLSRQPRSYLYQQANHWSQTLARLRLPWCYLCQRANHWNTGSGAIGATLGLPLPTSKSLEYIALGLLGLPWGYLCQRANHWNTGSWATGSTLGLALPTSRSLEYRLWGYWGYLGATFANEHIISIQAVELLGLPWGYLGQRANHWNTLLWGYCGCLGASFAILLNWLLSNFNCLEVFSTYLFSIWTFVTCFLSSFLYRFL